jgi:hypothetical protein
MKYIKKRKKFLNENTAAPVREKPKVVPKPQPPVKPEPPQEPDWTTPMPNVNPGIKAEKESDEEVATKVAMRLRDEMEKSGEDIEKYID